MQKIGLAIFKSETDSMNAFIAYYTDDLLVTRIDLYDDYEKYDVLNTEHCFSAYYKDTNEYYLGDDSYVQKVIKLMSKISIMPGERKQEVEVVDGVAVITLCKTFEEKNGTATNTYMFKQVLIDGELTEESYISPDIEIKFGKVTTSVDLAVKPVNFVLYESYGDVLDFSNNVSYSSAEYYTEEELRLRYPGKLDHLYTYDSVVCSSLQQAIERLEELRVADVPRIAVDVETTGLGMGMFGPDCITGVVISFTETQSTYYPFRQEGCDYNLPIWFISQILEVYNSKGSTRKSCTFNGKMEIESFWKERPAFIKYSDYAQSWKSTLYDNTFNEDSYYTPSDFEKKYVKTNKFAQLWLSHPERINDSRLMTVFTNDDGLHTSIKLDQRRGKGIHKLKTISEKITGLFWLELDIIFKGEIRFNVLPANLIRLYACPDTMNTIRVCRVLEEQFPVDEKRVLEIENELNYLKSENEFFGLPMESEKLNNLILEDSYIKDLLEKRFREIHHTSKNIRSNPVKADIFYNRLKAPIVLRTKTGAPSASNAALEAILEDGVLSKDVVESKGTKTPDIAIFTRQDGSVCTYDKLSEEEKAMLEAYNVQNVKEKDRKIKTRIVIKGKKLDSNKYPSLVILSEYNKICKELGALTRLKKKSYNDRFQFYIISDGADSDRQTSDAHQFSDTMKKCVVADSKYHKLISCDYKQVELRILAFLSHEEELMNLQKDPVIDVHRAVTHIIKGKEIWDISAEERKINKAVNFGVVYGMTEWGLVKRLHGIKYTKQQLLECMKMILDFYNGLPGIKEFKEQSETMLMDKGYVETAFGFRRYFSIVKDPTATEKDIDKAKKAANNTRVQGFGATLLKLAECHYGMYIREKHWDDLVDCDGIMLPKVRMMLSIHDEVLISAHESIPIEEIIEMCKVCQEIPVKGAPPFFAAPAFVNCWYDGKDDAYEIPITFRDEILDEWKKSGKHLLHYDTYLDDLNNYRKSILTEWMDGLIAKYKTQEEVIAHVRHPDLTHVLISSYIKGEDNISEHRERIAVAVKRYMEGRAIDLSEDNTIDDNDSGYLGDDQELGKFIYFDDNGEQIVEYVDDDTEAEFEEEEDDMNTLVVSMPEYARRLEPEYVYYALRECLIDITPFYMESYKEDIHNAICNVAMKNPGKYELNYVFGKSIAKVGYKVSYVPDEFNYAIKEAYLRCTEDEVS